MKIQLLHTLKSTFVLTLVLSASIQASNLPIDTNESWSVDGGVFHSSDRTIPEGVKTLIIKDTSGNLRIVERGEPVANRESSQQNATVIKIDNIGPHIEIDWKLAEFNQSGVKIGPNSELSIRVEDGELYDIIANGAEVSDGEPTVVDNFNEHSKGINIIAKDEFNNISEKYMSFSSDFDAPVVEWELLAPAIKNENTWFAAKSAELRLNISDESAIAVVKHNDNELVSSGEVITVSQGDTIQVVDHLENRVTVEINWQQDDTPPKLIILGGGAELINSKRINVRTNQVFELTAMDDGVGIKSQTYKGLSTQWQPLPKKFRFTHKGNYRIKVKLEDLVGNVFEKNLQVKVKR